jgi:hypothetical protein
MLINSRKNSYSLRFPLHFIARIVDVLLLLFDGGGGYYDSAHLETDYTRLQIDPDEVNATRPSQRSPSPRLGPILTIPMVQKIHPYRCGTTRYPKRPSSTYVALWRRSRWELSPHREVRTRLLAGPTWRHQNGRKTYECRSGRLPHNPQVAELADALASRARGAFRNPLNAVAPELLHLCLALPACLRQKMFGQ